MLVSSDAAPPANFAVPAANWMRRMDPDFTRASPPDRAVIRRGFLGVRRAVFRTVGGAGFFTLGAVDAIAGGGGGGAAILGVLGFLGGSGAGRGEIIGGGGGATCRGVRATGGGGTETRGLRGRVCRAVGGVRRAVRVAFLGTRGVAIFLRGVLTACCLTDLGGVRTTRGAAL